MKKSILLDVLKISVVLGLVWLAFAYFSGKLNTDLDLSISVANEEKLGKVLVDELLIDNPRVKQETNEIVDSAVQAITKRLVKSIGLTDYQYTIRVIKSEDINAFTMPGGNIFVYTGLLKFAESPDEVAAVLAHEIGHAENKHVVKRLAKELGVALLFSILSGGDAVVLNEVARTATSTVFDREQEREADDYCMSLMEKAKLNPKSLATFFRRVDEMTGDVDNNMEIIMTHPNNNSRIKNALEYKLAANFKALSFNMNWQRVIDAVNAGDEKASNDSIK
jgi:predicted Zn-dependent protease